MKRLLVSSFLLLFFTMAAFAQGRPASGGGGNSGGGTQGSPTIPTGPSPSLGPRVPSIPDIERPVFLSGKVVLADGGAITEPAAILTICGSRKRIETYTDSHGSFSFELKKKSNTMAAQTADMSSLSDENFTKANSAMQWKECDVQASLPGFVSESVPLIRSLPILESTDIGRITLRSVNNAQGSVLSATSAAAPGNAKKALEKGLEQVKKNKLAEAQKSMEKAVEIYPQYAVAWTELGRLQYMSHDDTSAQHSFERALAADSKYAKPYLGLAQLSVDKQQWQSVVDITDKLLALNSVDFPAAWFLNSAAYYNLNNLDAAEKSAVNGVKTDPDHHYPRLEHLLGGILLGKRDYQQAAEHLRTFVRLSTQPNEVAEAQKQLQQAEQMSAGASLNQQKNKPN